MQTIKIKNNVYILSSYSIVGPLEAKGPLKRYFDYILKDDTLGEKNRAQVMVKMHEFIEKLYKILSNPIEKTLD